MTDPNTESPVSFAGMSLLEALAKAPISIVLTDPRAKDNPIVYVNDTFTTITGYARDFAIGRNCRFLQQDDRDQEAIKKLRAAIASEKEAVVDVRNYRPDGEMFWNRLMISPLVGEDGTVLYFVGLQLEIEVSPDEQKVRQDRETQRALEEIQHRVKNHLAMVVSMIRLQSRGSGEDPKQDFNMLARRVETLQLLYEELSGQDEINQTDGEETVALGAYLSRVANAVAHLDGRSGVRVNIDAEKLRVPFQTATQLGLILSELMTNALQHAFEDRDEGLLEIEAKTLSNGVFRLVVSDDGVGISDDVNWPADGKLGGRIIESLVRGLEGNLDVAAGDVQGTTVRLDVPKAGVTVQAEETVDA
ncbi:PAS domain-containing protein [Aestuariibius sp. 2305UL40-4]|uniref:PAS domain-containing protein n=1 Tax=Aestuariibius violaceus TaxID=3234132 RepID=UPI00345F0972